MKNQNYSENSIVDYWENWEDIWRDLLLLDVKQEPLDTTCVKCYIVINWILIKECDKVEAWLWFLILRITE